MKMSKIEWRLIMNRKAFSVSILFSIFIFLYSFLNCQEIWEQSYNFDEYFQLQTGYEVSVHELEPRCLQITSDGGYAVLMELALDVQTVLYHGVCLLKVNQFGEIEWIKLLSYDPSMSFYNTALADINFGRGFVINSNNEYVIPLACDINGPIHRSFLINLASNGDYNWVKIIRDPTWPGKLDFLSSIKQTSDGDYFAVGKFKIDESPDCMEVVKFNTLGDTLWTKPYDYMIAYDLELDPDDNPIITAITYDTPFCIKLDSEGNIIWQSQLGESATHNAKITISEQNANDRFYIGYIKILYDIFIKEITSNGDVYDSYQFNLSESYEYRYPISLVFNDSNIFFTGRTEGDYDINCIDYEGNFSWQFEKKWYGKGVDVLKKTADSNFAVISVTGDDNLVLTKFDGEGNYTSIHDYIIGTNQIQLSNFPNPFNPETTISFELQENFENPILEIFNIKGNLIKQFSLTNNQTSVVWDSTNHTHKQVSSSIYYYRIKSNEVVSKPKKMLLLK